MSSVKLDKSWRPLSVKSGAHRCFEDIKTNEVIKIPRYKKNKISFEEATKSLRVHQLYFGDFIPNTKIEKSKHPSYFSYEIRQKKVDGKELKYLDMNNLSKKTLENLLTFLDIARKCNKNSDISIDLIGYQGFLHNFYTNRQKILHIFKFLKHAYNTGDIMKSTNIMMEGENIFFVDCVSPLVKERKISLNALSIYRKITNKLMLIKMCQTRAKIKNALKSRTQTSQETALSSSALK